MTTMTKKREMQIRNLRIILNSVDLAFDIIIDSMDDHILTGDAANCIFASAAHLRSQIREAYERAID